MSKGSLDEKSKTFVCVMVAMAVWPGQRLVIIEHSRSTKAHSRVLAKLPDLGL